MNTIFQSTILGFIQGIGPMEIFFIFLVVLLLFGPKKLPELARGFGKSIKEFKKATSEIEEDIKTAIETEEKPVVAQTPAKAVTSSPQQTPAEAVTSVATETQAEPSQKEGNSISPTANSSETDS